MIRIRWAFIPDYQEQRHVDLIVCYSGKRYIALNVKQMNITHLERHIPEMIKTLKKDISDGRTMRQMRKRNQQR